MLKNRGKEFKQLISLMKEKNERNVKHIQNLQKRSNEMTEDILERKDQFSILKEAKEFLEKQLSAKIEIEDAEKSKLEKAKNADVNKPAILLE